MVDEMKKKYVKIVQALAAKQTLVYKLQGQVITMEDNVVKMEEKFVEMGLDIPEPPSDESSEAPSDAPSGASAPSEAPSEASAPPSEDSSNDVPDEFGFFEDSGSEDEDADSDSKESVLNVVPEAKKSKKRKIAYD